LLEGLLEVFFPPACIGCPKVLPRTAFFCQRCEAEVERLPSPFCASCAEPGDFDRRRCPRCQLRAPPFSRAFAPFVHQGPIARAIHLFKYEDRPELAPALSAVLTAESARFLATAPELICAIPLHRARLRRRKYDQAQLLAGELARLTGRRCVHDGLARVRSTQRQVGLSELGRDHNVSGAFRASASIRGQCVLLVDDVFTTGATARAAASALLEWGASDVQVLTLARAFSNS
jgi:ComF family protein